MNHAMHTTGNNALILSLDYLMLHVSFLFQSVSEPRPIVTSCPPSPSLPATCIHHAAGQTATGRRLHQSRSLGASQQACSAHSYSNTDLRLH